MDTAAGEHPEHVAIDARESNDSDEADKGPVIVADVAASFTYASYQNAIPVIRSIQIENNTGLCFENCRLELTSSPSFLRPKSWTVDRLIPGDKLSLGDRKVELDAGYLAGLNEAERGEITLRLYAAAMRKSTSDL